MLGFEGTGYIRSPDMNSNIQLGEQGLPGSKRCKILGEKLQTRDFDVSSTYPDQTQAIYS